MLEEQKNPIICSFRQNNSIVKEKNTSWSIVSTVGGKITGIHAEKQYQKYFCPLGNAESFVEKFLLIKDIEQELTNFNWAYFLELEVDKAIFWFQGPITNFDDRININ